MPGTRFGARTLARSQALQLLFQAEATGRLVSEVLAGDYVLDDDSGPLDEYARELALGADGYLHELDSVINEVAHNWSVKRMPSVDRNLLRLAVYEMAREEGVATAVSINEFVELAKAYGTDDSSRFVNGLLGRVASRIDAGEDVLGAAAQQDGPEAGPEAEEPAALDGEAGAGEPSPAAPSGDEPATGASPAGAPASEESDALPEWARG